MKAGKAASKMGWPLEDDQVLDGGLFSLRREIDEKAAMASRRQSCRRPLALRILTALRRAYGVMTTGVIGDAGFQHLRSTFAAEIATHHASSWSEGIA